MVSKLRLPILLAVIVLIIDQASKIWIKTNLQLNETIPIFGNWAYILFTENPGMAFGLTFGGEWGKLILTLFRIVAVAGISWYIVDLARKNAPTALLVCFGLILAGAIGNIIDSVFYGMIFSSSAGQVAEIFPAGGGYGKFLHGEVVDMFYFPIIQGNFPSWFPFWGGEPFTFFRPVFNVADSAITVGVASILIFHRKFFSHQEHDAITKNEEISSNK